MNRSAGILPYRLTGSAAQVLLVHPGGPFWAKKDLGAWSIAKGEYDDTETGFEAAKREFQEETGFLPPGPFFELTPIRQPRGKVISVWATETDWDPARLVSNRFTIEWPPKSGREREFPEVDRAVWFPATEALRRIQPGQAGFIEELVRIVAAAA